MKADPANTPGPEKATAEAAEPKAAALPVGDAVAPVDQLTPDEQMERFAQDLKDHDWGHQPC